MRVGDVMELTSLLAFTAEKAEFMVESISPDGVAEGDVTYLGVKVGRARVTKSNAGLEVLDVQ